MNTLQSTDLWFRVKMLVVTDNFSEKDLIKYPRNMGITFMNNKIAIVTSETSFILQEIITGIMNQIRTREPVFNAKGKFLITSIKDISNRAHELLQIGDYSGALAIFDGLIEKLIGIEMFTFKEYKAITLFLKDFFSPSIEFNKEIEKIFKEVIEEYKKKNLFELLIEADLRLITYYSYFPQLREQMNHVIDKLYKKMQKGTPQYQVMIYLECEDLLERIGLKRKANLFFYYSLQVCLSNEDLHTMVPYMIKELTTRFDIYDIADDLIQSQKDFIAIHKKYIRSTWKPIQTFVCLTHEDKSKKKEINKKRLDGSLQLYICNICNSIKKYALIPYWEPMQFAIYEQLINYFRTNTIYKELLQYRLSALQTLFHTINQQSQIDTIQNSIRDSLFLQEKIFINTSKLPVLMRIIPISSDIKFDSSKNHNKKNANATNASDDIFLYNPWEKEETINYYWTAASYQKIKIQLHNPLKTMIMINKIIVLVEGDVKPISYPSSISIPSLSSVYIVCKIRPSIPGILNITGVKYEIGNTISIQYADYNGNGLYSNFENLSKDSLSLMTKKKELISLSNIKIFPEIPLLDFKILDDSSKVMDRSFELYEFQYYTFSFLLENIGNYPINELTCFIYAYKNDDYKISLDELKITHSDKDSNKALIDLGKNYVLNYKYLHKKSHCRIEFRIYYVSYLKNEQAMEEDLIIKPYLYYTKSFNTLTLSRFSNLKVIPVVSSAAANALANLTDEINKNSYFIYSSSQTYYSFSMNNIHNDKIQMSIRNGLKIIKEESCEAYRVKEISFVVDSSVDKKAFEIDWKFAQIVNSEGTINLDSIFSLIDSQRVFEFVINTHIRKEDNKIDYTEIEYKVINKTNTTFTALQVNIYLFQVFEEEYVFNSKLKGIFYEGSLYPVINDLKPFEEKVFWLKVYPIENETFNTTCLIIEKDKKTVHLCPISREL